MFSFSCRGVIVGINSNQDGSTSFLKIKPSLIDGVRVQSDEAVGVMDVSCDPSLLGGGVGFNSSVSVDGVGYIGDREWTPKPTQAEPKPRSKVIHNFRLIARTIKLAK